MSEPNRREEELFLAALEISDALQRAAYLKGACGKDTGLHAQLLELLAAHDATQGPLDRSPAASFQSPTVAHQVSTLSGTMIAGKYKLVEPIGEGGMGSVWLAEQREPVKRLVAIKLIKAGMDSKAVLARFEAERQALALMDHPNIAPILDGGVTESGLPYFVMELVKGVPITQFCDARKLTPQQRLELFVPVCQAIQHAHQKGIIHRDIKPSNVMVSLYDDRPVPKVIDFGVAKATGQALTEQTLITGFSVVGTPQYMSPEQATFNQLDIDTRSDIYSLGVLLYELLVGSPPFQKQDLIDKDRERVHRTRIAATMEACPRPTHILFHTAPVRQAAYSPDGRKLVTLAWNTEDKMELRIWDALSGQQIGPVISPSAIADLRSSSATIRFDGSGSKIILVRSRKSIEKIEGPLSVLDIWDAMTGLKEGSSTALFANPAQQIYMEVEHADKTKPAWPPKSARLVDLDTFKRKELPPVMDSWRQAAQIRIDPTSQYCFVPPGNEGDCELWALSPLRRISRWGGGSLTGRTASGEMQFPRLNVRFAPDGSRLVAVVDNAGQAKTTIIYSIETATGRELFPPLVFPARLQGQYMVNISADATRIIIDANDKGVGGLRIYDTGTGKVIATYQPQPLMSFVNTGNYYETRTPHFVIVSAPIQPEIPAGNKRLNTSSTGFFELMDAATGKPISPPIWCEDAAYSPDMSKLLTLDEQGAMKLWNVLSGKPIAALVGTKGKVSFRGPMASKFSPSNRFVSILTDESIRIWDTQTGQPTSGLLEHRGKIVGSEFNPKTEQFFTLSEDGTARLWDPIPDSTAKETVTQTPVGILETDAAGEHVAIRSTLYGAPISVWDVAAGNKFSPATSLNTDEKTLLKARDLHFAGSGQTVFASNDISGFRIWESASGRVLRHVPTRNGEQIFAARSYDGRRLVTVRYPDGEARWWDAVTGQPLGNITPGDGQPIRLGAIYLYRPNPYLVTLRYRTEPNKALEVEPTVFYPARDTPTKLPWRPAIVETDLKSVFQPLPLLPISLNGRTLDPMTGPDGLSAGWRLVDDASNRELASLPAGQAEAIAGGNRFVIEELDKLSVWDSATGASVSRIPLTPKVSYDFRFNGDGDRVVLATMFPNPPLRSAPQLWNLTTGRPVCAPWTQSEPILGFEWSPDGRRIATWAGPVTQIWDSETGQMTGRPISHSSSVMQVRFSPDGKSLTTVIKRSAANPDNTRMVSEGQSSKDRSGRSVPSRVVVNSPLGTSGGLVFLWDVATGESIAPPIPSFVPIPKPAAPQVLPPFTSEIGPLFSSDGRRLFTTPTSRSVRAWMVPLDDRPLAELVTTAEALSGRRFQEPGSLALLSSEEWKSALNRVPGTTASIRTPEQQMARDSERAETLYAENEWEGSLSHLNSLIAAESSKAKHFQMRGWCRHLLGIPDDALADMNKAIELGADDREIWAHLGTIYLARNQFLLAAEDYRKMARFPDATNPPGLSTIPKAWWSDVARLMSWAGHPKEYRWACDRLLENDGLKPPYTNGEFLAFLLSSNGLDDYAQIILVCRDELEKDKRAEQIPKLKSRLGLVLLRANQFAEAAKIIESIDPNDLPTSTVYRSGANELVLAIAYHHLGYRDQAEQHLQKGLEQTAALEKDIQSGVKTASTALLLPLTLAREAEQLIRGEPKAGAAVPSPLSTSPPTLKNSSTKP